MNARLIDVLCTQEANTELLLKQNFKLQNVLVENNNRLLTLLEQQFSRASSSDLK